MSPLGKWLCEKKKWVQRRIKIFGQDFLSSTPRKSPSRPSSAVTCHKPSVYKRLLGDGPKAVL
jgi:hypothetical protein